MHENMIIIHSHSRQICFEQQPCARQYSRLQAHSSEQNRQNSWWSKDLALFPDQSWPKLFSGKCVHIRDQRKMF